MLIRSSRRVSPGRLRAGRLLIRSHSCWASASRRKCCRSASTRWAARRPWASRKELRSVPRAAAARSSRSRSSSVARSSMRLVLAGRWPCGLVLVKATTVRNVRTLYGAYLEKGAAAPREPQAICSVNAPSASRSASSWQRCSNSCWASSRSSSSSTRLRHCWIAGITSSSSSVISSPRAAQRRDRSQPGPDAGRPQRVEFHRERGSEGRSSDQRRAALGFAWCCSSAAWLEMANTALIIVRLPALQAFWGQHLVISGR